MGCASREGTEAAVSQGATRSNLNQLSPIAGVLMLAVIFQSPHITAPLADNLQIKQVYVANRARSIARPPLNPLRSALDFLDIRGGRIAITEEAPLYTGLLAVGYRLFGERDWIGRTLSLAGTLVALAAFAGLARREHGPLIGTTATLLLAVTPLLVFYGRAVLPDTWMLAMMLTAAACYRRYLDGASGRWLVAAMGAASLAPIFKYYGVMILIPLAGMTLRHGGPLRWRALRFFAIAAATIVPVGLWVSAVFLRTSNPLNSGWNGLGRPQPYLFYQAPEVLLRHGFYLQGFFLRFLAHDCGPVTAALVLLGVVAAIRGRRGLNGAWPSLHPLLCWTAMGLTFYFVFAPKLVDHDYYELMLLPAAALWGAFGFTRLAALANARPRWRVLVPVGALVLAAAVQSPWCMSGMFRIDRAKLILADRLKAHADEGRRVVLIGPGIELATAVHYCQREGWALQMQKLPERWDELLASYRTAGAQVLALYFDPRATRAARCTFEPLINNSKVLESATGNWARIDGLCSYWIVDLR
jgi:hypothetical protein